MATNARRLMYAMGVLYIALSSGCATIQHGGAPIPAFDLEKDIKELTDTFGPKASIAKYYQPAGNRKDARDEFIDGRLALYNIRYIQFIRDLGVDKQHLDAATEVLLMGIGVAGTLVGGSQAKTNLAALATLITGTKVTVDKHFYFEKTVPALVATMNAQRKEVLLRILGGRQLDPDRYPFTQALADLYDYEQAGTLIGAINTIQVDAGAKEKNADKELRKLELPTNAQFEEKYKLATALESLGDETPANLAKINKILKELGFIQTDKTDYKDAAIMLSDKWREAPLATLPKWRAALKNASINVKD